MTIFKIFSEYMKVRVVTSLVMFALFAKTMMSIIAYIILPGYWWLSDSTRSFAQMQEVFFAGSTEHREPLSYALFLVLLVILFVRDMKTSRVEENTDTDE